MKENYRPWTIDISAFPHGGDPEEQLKFLIGFAVLAPSSHNSQPWKFGVADNSISVFMESSRRLTDSDKNDRQLFISLGCAITNLVVAADYYGYSSSVQYHTTERLAALITLTASQPKTNHENHLIFSIPTRTNNRNRYENRLPDESFVRRVGSLAVEDVRIDLVHDEQRKNRLADAAIQAGIAAMEDEKFRKELSRYVKSNVTKSKIGMPAFGMGIPTPVSFLVPALIKRFNMNRVNRKKDEKLLKIYTPLFAVISTREDNPVSWMNAGEIYERIALMATQAGLSTAVWAAPIQIGEFYKKLQSTLEIDFRPQVFFRLGYPIKSTPHSPRLLAEEVLRP